MTLALDLLKFFFRNYEKCTKRDLKIIILNFQNKIAFFKEYFKKPKKQLSTKYTHQYLTLHHLKNLL